MKRFLFSSNYPSWAFNLAMFILRLGVGILLVPHGYSKLTGFSQMKTQFMSFLGLGASTSLALCIFAEFFCSILLLLGFFTRLAALALVINFCVVVFIAHNHDFFGKGEMGSLYLISYIAILLAGAGKISLDNLIGGK